MSACKVQSETLRRIYEMHLTDVEAELVMEDIKRRSLSDRFSFLAKISLIYQSAGEWLAL
jgi:hypothetical protein